MKKITQLGTLADQQRIRNSTLDRGKKIVVGCLCGAAFVFSRWSALPAYEYLMFACLLLAAAVAINLRQLRLRGFFCVILTAILGICGLYFFGKAAAVLIVTAAMS